MVKLLVCKSEKVKGFAENSVVEYLIFCGSICKLKYFFLVFYGHLSERKKKSDLQLHAGIIEVI